MTTLRIDGLDGEGPGDIVGAFTGEAGISNARIGEIDVRDGSALVEVDAEVAGHVADALDGHRIGRSTVSVELLDDADRIDGYIDRFSRLVQLEREEEMRLHEQEIRELTGPEREAKGRALLDMRGRDLGEGLGGHVVKFRKQAWGTTLPDLDIAVGDLVMVSRDDPLRDDNPTGTVIKRTDWSLTVVLDGRPDGWVLGQGLRIDLYVNDIVYQRMLAALEQLRDPPADREALRDVLVGRTDPAEPAPVDVDRWRDGTVNEPQRDAVRRGLGADPVHLVHGPPGTGKTTTAIEVVRQAVDRGETVLATAPSNTAVDNLLEMLVGHGVDAVRIGHPARVTPSLRRHTLDLVVEDHPDYQEATRLRERAFELRDRQEDLTYPSGRWRRGMSNEQIRDLADQGRGARGVPPDRIEEMARWLDLKERTDELFARVDELEDRAVAEILDAADVVCTTNASAGKDLLADRRFDLLVLDEATQATEPSCLIPMVHARRAVLVGDHRQLPPTIKSRQAERQGLSTTLFERLAEAHGDRIRDMLQVQYRMHEDIMAFSDGAFYDGRLQAHPSVAGHTLDDLGIDDPPAGLDRVLAPELPVVLADTSDVQAPERSWADSVSKHNPIEAGLVAEMVRALLDAGMDARDVAVITPYRDQVDAIRRELSEAPEDLEVDTVDGFQGREKEAVLISLVRSNPRGDVGFLEDVRRLNVALTRARRKLVVVGDVSTVGSHPVYEAFVDHVHQRGRRVPAAELR